MIIYMITSQSCCRICGNTDLIQLTDLGPHALSGRFPFKDEPTPLVAPLILIKCNDERSDERSDERCGLVQLKHNVPPSELYFHNYGYRSGLNRTMTSHLCRLTDEIVQSVQKIEQGDIILDIGSNDCTLLKSYPYPSSLVQYVGIDPTGDQFREYYTSDVKLGVDFFNYEVFSKLCPNQKAKIITSIAMFYDLPAPIEFMRDIKRVLHPDGLWILEQSYIVSMLQTFSFDTICHEHLEYYALKQMEWMTQRVGLKIVDVTLNDCNGGSFRLTVAHDDSTYQPNQDNIEFLHRIEKAWRLETRTPYDDFDHQCQSIKKKLTSLLLEYKQQGKEIYLYGASTKGNTLLQYFGLDHTVITAAAERNVEKYGRRTPQTDIPIISEKEMREKKPDVLLVLPWHFKKEFLAREQDYLNAGGTMIFPLPELDAVRGEKRKRIPN